MTIYEHTFARIPWEELRISDYCPDPDIVAETVVADGETMK